MYLGTIRRRVPRYRERWPALKEHSMMVPEYPQQTSPRPYLLPTDAAPQPPALYEPKPRGEHVHSWGTDLRCVGCGWTLHAVLARHRAEKEAHP